MRERIRRLSPALCAVLLAASLFGVTRAAVATPDPSKVAPGYKFTPMSIPMPAGYEKLPKKTVRDVNPAYQKIRSWISSVGASIAINDLTGHGRASGMCLVDTRTDSVVVTHTPTAPAADRFAPFILDAAPLHVDSAMAPMGCAPGDFNSDGRMDLLVYYWGRTPILFMADKSASGRAPSYRPTEVVPSTEDADRYTGEPWNTNAVSVADYDGDGHPDLMVGNYFPNSAVLDPHGQDDVVMNDSMSNAKNGGGIRVLRWLRNDGGKPVYVEDKKAVPYDDSTGWTLALGGGDLTDDLLPEVYAANDFGHDHLFYNESTPGDIRFSTATGDRGWTTPKSFVLGKDSFKGMGVDFVDLYSRGKFDMIASNITTAWGLEESNYVWRNDADTAKDMASDLGSGHAPFSQQAQEVGLAWTGWTWDIKGADLKNSGKLNVLQTAGFVQGDGHNRWPWLQELATSNDVLLREPRMWPKVGPGDDIAGHQPMAVYAPADSGKYVDIADHVGIDSKTPTRGIAIGDTRGTGTLDFAVARQWGPPAFYKNDSPDMGRYLELHLYRPADKAKKQDGGGPSASRTPAYNAQVTVRTADGRTMQSQLDGGSGHSGKRGFDVHFGLGSEDRPVSASIAWLDNQGERHRQTIQLDPGTHSFMLTDTAEEVSVP
ncbi:CRTAC1 family protein [Streptomyces spectabilis]|uniref:CRTAC1 family protein n=2 Tax=Streptomyces spectabilis TaxID=68270 RepID=A0A5P2X2A5_STRST|nr:CRTAC1 family protein [Streptomyces spectabilis]MCI3900237.1 CRTAC1 family protein [Streptomyces spectabilis]QEV57844.1 CRTAC1 family protein [Streptomyces spectabilis]GGV09035.1 RNA-binding protein [Streptomyces spectabilis]